MPDTQFHGWTVTSDETQNTVTLTKPHPAGIDGILRVHVGGGADTPHQIVRATGARHALAEDVRVSNPDDVSLWQDRLAQADAYVKRLHEDDRRTREDVPPPTPADGQDAIIDAPTMTVNGGAIAPQEGNS